MQTTPEVFHVGQKVNVKAYTDCFQKYHEATLGMTVVEIEHIRTESIAPYDRIKAVGESGKGYFQAADRFFESAEIDTPSHITDPVDDGSCDPLYGSRMDDADLGRN